MHLSMHSWPREEPLEVTARRLARHGYESVELDVGPDTLDPAAVREVLAAHGLSCWGVVASFEEPRTLLSENAEQRAAAVATALDRVRFAAAAQAQVVMVVPAYGDTSYPGRLLGAKRWGWAVESLGAICAEAQAHGLRVAVEPLNRYETNFIYRTDQALALADELGPVCGLALDSFHLNLEEADPLAAIERAGDRIADFHVSDTNRLASGMGHCDWPATVEALRASGYDGALAFEPVLPRVTTPMAPPPAAAEREILEREDDRVDEETYDRLVAQTAATLLPLLP